MAFATLNCSVDIPDELIYNHPDANSNTSINEMESVAEIVAECVMNIHDAFPENKNGDGNSNSFDKRPLAVKYFQAVNSFRFFALVKIETLAAPAIINSSSDFISDILSPPPRG